MNYMNEANLQNLYSGKRATLPGVTGQALRNKKTEQRARSRAGKLRQRKAGVGSRRFDRARQQQRYRWS